MEKIIRSYDLKTHVMNSRQREFMKHHNEHPTFDNSKKEYNYLKTLKTNTDVHGWHFEYRDSFYTATQNIKWRGAETVQIYESDKKGTLYLNKLVKEFKGYCDIETAVDLWTNTKN